MELLVITYNRFTCNYMVEVFLEEEHNFLIQIKSIS